MGFARSFFFVSLSYSSSYSVCIYNIYNITVFVITIFCLFAYELIVFVLPTSTSCAHFIFILMCDESLQYVCILLYMYVSLFSLSVYVMYNRLVVCTYV